MTSPNAAACPQDKTFMDYITCKKWNTRQNSDRIRYLHRLAKDSKYDRDISGKIGGMLIYNQIIEQILVNIIEMSIFYVKAEIWPVSVSFDVELDKATFGKMIEYFRQFATIEENRDQILSYLRKYNTKRNQVVHDLFDIEDLQQLARELNEYAELADEIIALLRGYSQQVCDNFTDLDAREDLSKRFK